jgi:hypothetical protein
MNLTANTILARRRLIGSIRSRTHGSNQLKAPKSLKNHLQSKGRPHTALVTILVTQNLVFIVIACSSASRDASLKALDAL